MSKRASLRILDTLLIAAALTAAVYMGIQVYGTPQGTPHLVIESPQGRWVYQLDTPLDIEIPGAIGETHVHIKDGKASITESPCPNKTCIAAPAISRPGTWTACLPNHVLIRVEGSDEEKLDAEGY